MPTTSNPARASKAAVTDEFDPARHRDDDAVVGRVAGQIDIG